MILSCHSSGNSGLVGYSLGRDEQLEYWKLHLCAGVRGWDPQFETMHCLGKGASGGGKWEL